MIDYILQMILGLSLFGGAMMGFFALILICSFCFVVMDHMFRRYIRNREEKNNQEN